MCDQLREFAPWNGIVIFVVSKSHIKLLSIRLWHWFVKTVFDIKCSFFDFRFLFCFVSDENGLITAVFAKLSLI